MCPFNIDIRGLFQAPFWQRNERCHCEDELILIKKLLAETSRQLELLRLCKINEKTNEKSNSKKSGQNLQSRNTKKRF